MKILKSLKILVFLTILSLFLNNCNGKLPGANDSICYGLDGKKIKDLTYRIYDILGMKGIARMDYIINDNGIAFLIEINSVPGMSKESIVPQMIREEKLHLENILI